MSRRTVTRFALTVAVAASLTAPAAAQVYEPRTGSFQFSGNFDTDAPVPETAPMPRAKGGFTFELDVRLTLGRTAAVAPPCCAFDCRPACEVVAAPMPREAIGRGLRLNVGNPGRLTLPTDLEYPIVKGPFDKGQTVSLSAGVFGGPVEETPPAPGPVCPPTECRTPPCPAPVAAPRSRFVDDPRDYFLHLAATPPAPTPTPVPQCPVTAAGFPFVCDPCGPIWFGFGRAERLGTDFPVPPLSAYLPGTGPVLPRPAAPTVRSFEYHLAHPGRPAVAPPVVFQTPPLGGCFTSYEYLPVPPAVVRTAAAPFTGGCDGWFPPALRPAVPMPVPAIETGYPAYGRWVSATQVCPPPAPVVAVPLPRMIVEVIGDYRIVSFDRGFRQGSHQGSFVQIVPPPLPAPAAYPPFAGPCYPPPLAPAGPILTYSVPAAVPLPRAIVEVVGELRTVGFDRSLELSFGPGFHAGSHPFAVQLARPLPAPAAYPPFAGPGYPPPLAAVAPTPPCVAPCYPPAACGVPPAPAMVTAPHPGSMLPYPVGAEPPGWCPTPPPNVPAGDFAMMADALGRMVGGAQSPFVRPAAGPSCSGLPPLMPAGGCAATDPVLVPAPATGTVGGCCVPVPAPRVAAAVEKPGGVVGTWVREVGPVVYVLKVAPDHLTVTVTAATEGDDKKVSTEGMVLTADYHLAKDGATLVGLITGMDAALDGPPPDGFDLPRFAEEVARLQKALTDKPFALTARLYGDALVVGNVRLPEVADGPGSWCPLGMLGGRYAAAGKVLPKPKAVKVTAPPALPEGRYPDRNFPQYFKPDPDFPLPPNSDRIPAPPVVPTPAAPPAPPLPTPTPPDAPAKGKKGKKKAETDDEKMKRLLNQSETLGPIGGPAYRFDSRQIDGKARRYWFNELPSHLSPERITGGILP
jgi:hypothetical protein